MNKIMQEVMDRIHYLVVDQVRYVYPSDWDDALTDAMWIAANIHLTDEMVLEFLKGKSITSNRKLARLASKIGVRALFDDESWIDKVSDYIITNRADCHPLWEHIKSLIEVKK